MRPGLDHMRKVYRKNIVCKQINKQNKNLLTLPKLMCSRLNFTALGCTIFYHQG